MVERYRRPAILLSTPPGEPARGSARSVEGLNITAAIAAQKDMLLNFGGHPMAAGLALEQEKLPEFRRRLNRTVEKMLAETQHEEVAIEIDGWLPLQEASLEVAEQIEQLAPFGPGNEKLTLASRNLSLKSASPLGRNKEHLKLTVEDEQGSQQTILCWDGAEEAFPMAQLEAGSKFDLAYTLRASDWRGTRQAQLEFVAMRLADEKPLEIPREPLEIVDFRGSANPERQLSDLALPASSMLWAEGEHKKQIGGVDRKALEKAETLVIWTTPASREELTTALATVRPAKVILFALDPGMDDAQTFLERLAGLVKFALNQRGGQASYSGLAAATAQKTAGVRLGLAWLEKRGQITLVAGAADELLLTPGGTADEAAATGLVIQLRSLLQETSAFRENFQKADAAALLNPGG